MAKAYSISVSRGGHSEAHSRREYVPKSAEESLASENVVIYDCGDDRVHFNDFFRPAIEEYNARQKRSDRKKDLDYLSALEDGRAGYGKGDKKEKPFYHYVVQIGMKDDLGVTDASFDAKRWRELKFSGKKKEAADYVRQHLNKGPDCEILKGALVDVAEELMREAAPGGRFHGMLVHGIVLHADEPAGTPHLDLRFSLYTEGERSGVSTRVSANKALQKMGYRRRKGSEMIQQLQDSFKEMVEGRMKELGYERKLMNNKEKHLSVSEYAAQKDMERLVQEIEEKRKESDEMLSRVAAQQRIIDKGEKAKEELEQAWSDMDAAETAARAAEDDRARFQREIESLKAKAEKYREDAMREAKAEAWDAYVEKVKDLKRRNPKKLYDQILADMEKTKGEKVLELGLIRSLSAGAAPLGAEAEGVLPGDPIPDYGGGMAGHGGPVR